MRLYFPIHEQIIYKNSTLVAGGGYLIDLKRCEALQTELSKHVKLTDDFNEIRLIAGVDEAFTEHLAIASIVVLEYVSLEVEESHFAVERLDVPYIPGFLSFREAPAAINAYQGLSCKPDLLMVDGCGVNHPRGIGLASHLGVVLDVPTIGVSKGVLCGNGVMPEMPGQASPLYFRGEQVGWLLKSTERSKPIVVAPGHRVSINTSLEITRHCLQGHKLPEPTRLAHIYANKIKNEYIEK